MFLRKQNIRLLIFSSLILSILLTTTGCRQKRAIDVPGRVDQAAVAKEIDMRVLIAEVQSLEVNFDGSFQAVGADSRNVQTFVKRPVPLKVEIGPSGISINNVGFGRSVTLSRPGGKYLEVNGRRYRGKLELHLSSNGLIRVVNSLPLEYYLAGVVAAEMPASWEIEALKTQAVAARTYSLYVKLTSGDGRQWDVRSTQADQVYKGVEAENARIWDVVQQTSGIVLTSGDSDVRYNLIPAYFSSTCGGVTVDSNLVFGQKIGPLSGVRCPYCKNTAPAKYYNWPDVVVSKAELYKKLCEKYPNLQALGGLRTIKVAEYVQSGDFYKFVKVDIIGNNGKSDWLKGDDFRFIIGPSVIRSTACKIEDKGSTIRFYNGRGYGHNVGMCQYGVQGMAREGRNYRDILKFYYPGVEIKRLY